MEGLPKKTPLIIYKEYAITHVELINCPNKTIRDAGLDNDYWIVFQKENPKSNNYVYPTAQDYYKAYFYKQPIVKFENFNNKNEFLRASINGVHKYSKVLSLVFQDYKPEEIRLFSTDIDNSSDIDSSSTTTPIEPNDF